jgi:2-oxoisovalerate dehydrogenase E2 component (dihydrolipoyl transacylase)
VVSVTGAPGDKVAVGSPLIVFEVGAPAAAAKAAAAAPAPRPASPATASTPAPSPPAASPPAASPAVRAATPPTAAAAGRIMTSPANRRRASEAGIDLATVVGTGPGGRIVREDLAAASGGSGPGRSSAATQAEVPGSPAAGSKAAETTEIKVIGLRRLIAERMSEAKRTIPHFAYVEEVDVTELEALRQHLNSKLAKGGPTFTYLPLVVTALTRVLESFPQCNVVYDAARGVLIRHRAVHVGIATQTPDGLKVPVVRHAQSLALPQLAAEIRRVTERARTNKATRDELVGSTITITSLGKLGGIASTPIINSPEVAIIGLNKSAERPVVHQGAVAIRRIMNLSSSFDHRFVDGYDAAAMIQALRELLEHPAMIFIP